MVKLLTGTLNDILAITGIYFHHFGGGRSGCYSWSNYKDGAGGDDDAEIHERFVDDDNGLTVLYGRC